MKKKLAILFIGCFFGMAASAEVYEAENAIVDENLLAKVADSKASGGYYVNMKDGALSFKVTVAEAGFYTLWASYSQPNDKNGKIQNLTVNGVSVGQISFPYVDTFTYLKASSKVRLSAGSNTIGITKSWGWVNMDYIELTPFQAAPFNITNALVNPNASENAKKMYSFLRENFQKKVISGVMTNTVMQNDGKYTPNIVENQTEVAWIIEASGKTPALIGLDFMHSVGLNSESEWHRGYTKATLSLAEDVYKKGGIPAYCWHWKDPFDSVETFYSPSSGNSPNTKFDLNKAFIDSTTCTEFNTSSAEYKAIISDLDIVAGHIKNLADKGIPVLWRPLHEASGKWFWWGYSGPKACKALYRLMFDRYVNNFKLNNLIWVWTTDEAADALDWYPGDNYVDIVGRDYYYYPRIANHSSLVASFEKVKDLFGGDKIIALSENGSVPYPDSLISDEAGWSYFMPWYGDYTMDGWAHDNTAADWKAIMNNSYVITLDKMPGWDKYVLAPVVAQRRQNQKAASIHYRKGILDIHFTDTKIGTVELFNLEGNRIAMLKDGYKNAGTYHYSLNGIAKGLYFVRIKCSEAGGIVTGHVLVK